MKKIRPKVLTPFIYVISSSLNKSFFLENTKSSKISLIEKHFLIFSVNCLAKESLFNKLSTFFSDFPFSASLKFSF